MKEKLSKTISIVFMVLVILLTSAFTLKNIFYFEIEIVGTSMVSTLRDNEKGLALKSDYIKEIKNGDIIIFKRDNKEIIKRVIGKPLDHVEITREGIYINDELMEENYLTNENKEATYFVGGLYNDITLKEDEYFVMGDNRSNSSDSRSYGPIEKENITGKLFLIYPSDYGSLRSF